MSGDLQRFRWLLIEQEHNALPTPFLVVLIFWLTMNLTYGPLAPRYLTVIAVMFVCALSLACAIFLILVHRAGWPCRCVESQAFYGRFRDKILIRATLSL
jgi:hypothetical protein